MLKLEKRMIISCLGTFHPILIDFSVGVNHLIKAIQLKSMGFLTWGYSDLLISRSHCSMGLALGNKSFEYNLV